MIKLSFSILLNVFFKQLWVSVVSHQSDFIWAEESLQGVVDVPNHAHVAEDLLAGNKSARQYAKQVLPGNPTKSEILAIQYISQHNIT